MTEVVIRCQGNSTAKLGELNIIQGHLKELTDKNYSKLKEQILKNGFVAPFFTWSKLNGQPKAKDLLDGTQRKLTLLRMLDEKIPMPEAFPIVEIDAPDEKAAKKIILALSSQYGKMTEESLFEFSHELLGFDELSKAFEFDAIDFAHYGENFFFEGEGETMGHENRGPNADEKLEKYLEKGFQEIKLYFDIETYQVITAKLDNKMLVENLADYSECVKRLVLENN